MHGHLVGLHMPFRTSDGSYFNSMVWVHIFIICRNRTIIVLTSVILLVNAFHDFVFILMHKLLVIMKKIMNELSSVWASSLIWITLATV